MGGPDELTHAATLSSGSDAEASAECDDLPQIPSDTYRVAGEIAHGGGGRILRAFDVRLQRWVALKVPLNRDGEAARRFRNEARVTARLEHPGIVPVHEAGRWPNGEPFYAMKLVSGRSLGEVVAATRALDDRLALLPQLTAVAEAMAYAHSQQVIHRDLKPSNIMVGPFGEAIIIDWGLSKDFDLRAPVAEPPSTGPMPESPTATASNAVLGTPAYMAPEQAEGPPADVRADVYSLGAVLYAVLCGHAPYQGSNSLEVLEQLKRGSAPPLRAREPGVPEDLATIVDKAMRRDPADRYADAAELAAELRRFQTGQMVRARHYSAPARLWRWLQRHRIAAAAVLAVVATVAVSFERVVRARNLAEARQDQLILAQARSSLAKDPTLAVAWARSYRGRGGADRPALDAIAAEAQSLGVARHVWSNCARAVLAPDGNSVACLDHGRLVLRRPGAGARRLGGESLQVVRWLPDGSLASIGEDGTIRRWDVNSDSARVVAQLGEPGRALQAGADGSIAAGGARGALLVVQPSGTTWKPARQRSEVVQVEVSPDGRYLATTEDDRGARVWRIGDANGHELPDPPLMKSVVFSPDSQLLAWGSPDGGVRIYDLGSGRVRVLRGHQYVVARVSFSPDGKTLASTGQDKTVRLWSLATGEARVLTLNDIAWRVFFSPDGQLLVAVTDQSAEQRVIDLRTLDVTPLRGHRSPLERVQFARDSRTLLTSATDGETRLWPVAPASERVLLGHTSPYATITMREDGTLLSLAPDGIRTWNIARGAAIEVHPSPMPDGSSFVVTEDGRRAVYLCPQLHVLDLATGRSQLLSKERFVGLSDGRKGRLFLGAQEDGGLRLFDLETGSDRLIAHLTASVWTMQGTADGARWAVGAEDGIVRLVEPEAGVRFELRGHTHKVRDVAFNRDGSLLASGGTDPVVRVWDTATGARRELVGHESSVEHVRFSPVAELLASNSLDGTIRLWDLSRGESRVLRSGTVNSQVAFSADGQRLYAGGADGVLREWDVAHGTLRRVLRGHDGEIQALLAPRSATWVATYADDHTLRVWPPSAERAPSLSELTTAELSRDERPLTRD